MNNVEIKKCPFCGEKVNVSVDTRGMSVQLYIKCNNCNIRMDGKDITNEAASNNTIAIRNARSELIDKWNNRSDENM